MLQLVTEPGRFLDERSQELSLTTPAWIVFFAGVAFAIETVIANQLLDPALAGALFATTVVFAVVRVLEQFITWFFVALVFVAVSKLLRGKISYYESLHAAGWGFPAILLSGLVRLVGVYVGLREAPQPDVPNVDRINRRTDILQGISSYEQFLANVAAADIWPVILAGMVACFLWAGYLWTHGIEQYGTGFERREAAGLAGVAVLLLVYLTV